MNPPEQQQRAEECREEVLRFLYERKSLAHSCGAVRRGINRKGFDFTDSETLDTLNFLKESNFIKAPQHKMGATFFYQITASGMLAHERGFIQ